MTISTFRRPATLAMALLLAGACSKAADDPGNKGGGTGGSGGSGGTPATQGKCDDPSIEILFSPMYSAYDGVHKFKVPAVVDSVRSSAVSWSASDPTMVDLQPDPATGGIMITAQKAGTVNIVAHAGGLCGTALLTVTSASADDWMVGSARYNEGISLGGGFPRGGGGGVDGGVNAREAACTNCHGDTATNGAFRTVAHSPQQTGGFSDQELIDIFTKGVVPNGGYFDEEIVSYEAWQRFHRWDMTPEQAKGMVVYLRSLTPVPQKGMRGDFGGRRDGGGRQLGDGGRRFGDGGGRMRDGGGSGGGGGPEDGSAVSTD
jgi:hypothetical protein